MLEEFWIAGGSLWSHGDYILLTNALKLHAPHPERLHPADLAYFDNLTMFCKCALFSSNALNETANEINR
jgi:hypothetical protein